MEKRLLEQALMALQPSTPEVLEVNFSGVNMRIPKDTPLVMTTVTTTVAVNPGSDGAKKG